MIEIVRVDGRVDRYEIMATRLSHDSFTMKLPDFTIYPGDIVTITGAKYACWATLDPLMELVQSENACDNRRV